MNLLNVLSVGTIVLINSLVLPTSALLHGHESIYRGGGHQVSIGTNGSYYGCNPKKQCLAIKNYSYRSRGQYIWENKGIAYSMTPLYNRQGTYRLKVIDRHRRVLLNQIMDKGKNRAIGDSNKSP
jgi:hypothetical protein